MTLPLLKSIDPGQARHSVRSDPMGRFSAWLLPYQTLLAAAGVAVPIVWRPLRMCEPVHTSRSIYLVVVNSTIYFVPASSAREPVGAQSGIDWGRAPARRSNRSRAREMGSVCPVSSTRKARDGLAETLRKKLSGELRCSIRSAAARTRLMNLEFSSRTRARRAAGQPRPWEIFELRDRTATPLNDRGDRYPPLTAFAQAFRSGD